MSPIDVQAIWSKVKVKLLFFVQMLSAQYLLPPLLEGCQAVAVDVPREYNFLNDFQVT